MWAAASAFESRGEGDAAARAAARVLELDPGHGEARLALRRLTRGRNVVRLVFRWGTLAAAILLACAWFALDSSSASAFARVKDLQEGRDPRQAVVDLRDEASQFPLSRHAVRIAELESGLYEKALAEDWSLLSLAIESLQGGDVSRADHLAGVLRARSLVPLVKVRAAELAREVALRTDRQEKLLAVARAHVAAGRYADAYPLFADLLRGARRDLFAANYQVPVRIETVPSGATVTIDRRVSGKSPAWCLLPSDPASVLALEARGYDGYRRVDPLGGALAGGAARLRVVLDLPRLWARAVPGGPLATDAGAASNPCLLGGDGVLRSFEASGQVRWETPVDPECDLSVPPRFAGPCVLIASRSGKVIAHALSHGRRVWAAQIQGPRDRGGLALGPMVGGQVLVFARGAALLIHPWTGFLVRRIASGAGEFSGQVGVLGDRGFLALGRGGMAVVDFTSGRLEAVREPERRVRWLGSGEDKVFRLDEDGRLGALGPDGRASLWERKLGPEYSFAALVDGNILCLASPRSGIQGLEGDTGTPLWKAQPEGSVTALLVAGSRLGIRVDRGGDGVLVILGVGDGAPRWEVDCRPGENASLGPAADALLISTPSTGLRAFRAPQS
jgi:outer membrane protein assembly factor BamB